MRRAFGRIIAHRRCTPAPSQTAREPRTAGAELDPTANTLYLLATSYTRLDIAAVLSSLYPAVTVLCSRWFLKKKYHLPSGVGWCLVSQRSL